MTVTILVVVENRPARPGDCPNATTDHWAARDCNVTGLPGNTRFEIRVQEAAGESRGHTLKIHKKHTHTHTHTQRETHTHTHTHLHIHKVQGLHHRRPYGTHSRGHAFKNFEEVVVLLSHLLSELLSQFV